MSGQIRSPRLYHDRGEVWEAEHYRRRCLDVSKLVRPEMVEEHRLNPFGYRTHHSLDLQRVDRLLKTYPANGTRHLPVLGDDGRWRIMAFRRHDSPTTLNEPVLETLDDAVHQIFLIRLAALSAFVQGQVDA
jgi:hypothetical protein